MKKPEDFAIGVWNLNWASRKPQRYMDLLSNHDADLWVLTETRDAVKPQGLPHHVYGPVRARDDERKWTEDSRWVSIWSRWPLQPVPTTGDPTRCVCARVEAPLTSPLLVYATVLPWCADNVYRTLEEKKAAITLQIQDLQTLKAQHPDRSLVLAGDFNQGMAAPSPDGDKTLQGVIESGLSDLCMTCVTAPARLGGRWPHRVIDHVAVSNDIEARFAFKHAWRKDLKLSDHGGHRCFSEDW